MIRWPTGPAQARADRPRPLLPVNQEIGSTDPRPLPSRVWHFTRRAHEAIRTVMTDIEYVVSLNPANAHAPEWRARVSEAIHHALAASGTGLGWAPIATFGSIQARLDAVTLAYNDYSRRMHNDFTTTNRYRFRLAQRDAAYAGEVVVCFKLSKLALDLDVMSRFDEAMDDWSSAFVPLELDSIAPWQVGVRRNDGLIEVADKLAQLANELNEDAAQFSSMARLLDTEYGLRVCRVGDTDSGYQAPSTHASHELGSGFARLSRRRTDMYAV